MNDTGLATASPRVLVSYRRDDSSGHAGRLFDRLTAALGPGTTFIDIDSIRPGEDFVNEIRNAVASSHVLIALIGKNWLDIRGEDRGRRLDDPADFVRLEIATALERNMLVIPALVQDARMPHEKDLPPDLAPLARRQAIEISDTRFNQDVERLIEVIRESGAVPGLDQAVTRTPASKTRSKAFFWRGLLGGAGAIAALSLTWWSMTFFRSEGIGQREQAVSERPVIRRLTVEPAHYITGHVKNVRLTWEVEGAADLTLAPFGRVDPKGSRLIAAPDRDTSFTLEARNRLGDTTGQAAVDVLSLDEFISVAAPDPVTEASIKRWLSEYLRSLEEIGYLPELRRVIVFIDPALSNAFYDGKTRRLIIGQSLSADRDVVLREYTHRMLLGPEFMRAGLDVALSSPDVRAIESGLADYLPASALDNPRIGEVAAKTLFGRPFIRTLINDRRFDKAKLNDMPQSVGEIWGGAFWDMRLALGRMNIDPLLLKAWGTHSGRLFVTNLLRLAATKDPKQESQIRSVFQERGFPF
jgi:hypothetical protein